MPRPLRRAVLSLTLLIAPAALAKDFKADPKYDSYRQFSFWDLKVETDYDTKKEYLELSSVIVESTMHQDPDADRKDPPTVKQFYRKVELFFDGKDKPAITLTVPKLGALGSKMLMPIHDGRVADSVELKLSDADLKSYRRLKPSTVQVVLYDKDGKIVTAAEASGPTEK
jgi:hypothetical protein